MILKIIYDIKDMQLNIIYAIISLDYIRYLRLYTILTLCGCI